MVEGNSNSRPLFSFVSPSSIPRIKFSPPFSWQCVDLTLELFLFRLFGAKCSNCQLPIGEKAYVMKAGQQTYHTDCFNCSVCQRRLTKGDMFYQTKSGSLLCKTDHDAALQHQEKPLTAGTSSKEELISTHDNLAALQGGSGSGSGSSTSSTPDSTVPSGHGTGSASQTSNPSEAVSSGKQHTKSSE